MSHVAHGHAPPHPGHLVLLLPLHPPVAEPDLDLGLRHTQGVGDLDPGEEIYFFLKLGEGQQQRNVEIFMNFFLADR